MTGRQPRPRKTRRRPRISLQLTDLGLAVTEHVAHRAAVERDEREQAEPADRTEDPR